MSILGAFSISTMALQAQATALHQIGTNVSNVSTGGYRRADVQFQSVLGNQMFGERDQGGIRPVIHQRIDSQGVLQGSTSSLDLAISGDGFFITSTDFAATDIVYTRDGSFRQAAVNDITVTDSISGATFTTKDGYLVDKNGYYVLGFPALEDGTFPTTGTPVPMRVDKNAFSASGLPTTAAELIVNLDSNAAIVADHLTAVNNLNTGGTKADGMETLTIDFVDSNGNDQDARLNFTKSALNTWDISATYQGAGTAQVDTVTLGGTIEAGDAYTVTVGGTSVSYTALATDTLASVVGNLVTALNGDSVIAGRATAAAGATPGTITLTAATAGTAITTSAAATFGPGIAQVDTLTVSGAIEASDVYQVPIGGTTVSYTTTGFEGSLPGVVSGIIATINGNSPVNNSVIASVGANSGEIILTSKAPGTPFTATTRVLDNSSTAQVDTVTIGSLSSTFEAGDIYSVVVDGTTVPYTVTGLEGGLAGIRTALVNAINTDPTVGAIVTAANGGPAGELTLTAQVPGTAFVGTAAATNGGATNDNTAVIATVPGAVGATPNTAAIVNTTANVTSISDNTASTNTTPANDTGMGTTPPNRAPP
ncbi:MAG: flagellar hook-basal body complex protein, partial [Alphaproteobacteria bacterium]|nr:flagellar hook-basal body complex protein [Alphaproteobacteria bacterium]